MTRLISDEAFAALEGALAELETSGERLRAVRPPPGIDAAQLIRELRRIRRPIRPEAEEPDDARPQMPTRPSAPPAEVLRLWRAGGAAWVREASRRDARAMLLAVKDSVVGPMLLHDDTFWGALRSRIRPRQADQARNAMYFLAPDPSWIGQQIRHRAALAPDEVPAWWRRPGPDIRALASAVATASVGQSFGAVLHDLGLPDVLPDSFMVEVVRASQAVSARDLAVLLQFIDRGRTMGSSALLHPSTREWVRRCVHVGAIPSHQQVAIAEQLRSRVGDVLSAEHDVRWVGLEGERRQVRSWLFGEVFRVVFTHLLDSEHRAQTESRRTFWADYDQSVEKVWILVCDSHRERLKYDDAVQKLRQQSVLEIRGFTGQPEQDGLWMLLRSSTGEVVTVLEGNANMPIRLRRGAVPPPAGVVDYHQARALFPEAQGPRSVSHRGVWCPRAGNALADLGIYPKVRI